MQIGRHTRILFMYWGRRGLTQFTLQLAEAAREISDLRAIVSVSRQNESFGAFEASGGVVLPVDTFASNLGAVGQAWRIPLLRRHLARCIAREHIEAVIDLMPHVWSPMMISAIRAAGARYFALVHDANAHPGDYRTRSVKRQLDQVTERADRVLTLSHDVARRLVGQGMAANRITTLFHPDLIYGPPGRLQPPQPGEPLRLLFIGRILPYKGVPLFLDLVDRLGAEGIAVAPKILGEGAISTFSSRLQAANVTIVNRWLSPTEIAAALQLCHAVVLPYTEASQSGVAAMALGAGVPVVVTPVGGLPEQVTDGLTGTVASSADADALATAVKRLLLNPDLYRTVCDQITRTADQRSMARFVAECARLVNSTG